jgi:hypothetical protein
VVVEVSNVGPATLPPEAWDDEAVAVRLHGDEEPWERGAFVSFDPERGLEPPGGGGSVTLGAEPISDSVTVSVSIDPDDFVAEAQEDNNLRTARVGCSR